MSSIEERVIRAIGKVVKDRKVVHDSTFEELGMDSLAIIEAAFEIEEEFDLRIPDGDMKQIRGVRDVIDGVARLLSEKS